MSEHDISGLAERSAVEAFWDGKILKWERNRYEDHEAEPGLLEQVAGRASTSLRFRLRAALAILAPHVRGRSVVEIGCGSGLLAQPLLAAGAAAYHGWDISAAAIDAALARRPADMDSSRLNFSKGAVDVIPPTGDAIVFSLGLVDWLSPAEIDRLFALGKGGDYLHAISERRFSLSQMLHRAYVHVSYGHRTGGYVPQYHRVEDLAGPARRHGLAEPNVYRDRRLTFGALLTSLTLPAGPL